MIFSSFLITPNYFTSAGFETRQATRPLSEESCEMPLLLKMQSNLDVVVDLVTGVLDVIAEIMS